MERQLTIRRIALDALHQDPANARAYGPENMAAIEASLARFGQAKPLGAHAGTGRVIRGDGDDAAARWKARLVSRTSNEAKEVHLGASA